MARGNDHDNGLLDPVRRRRQRRERWQREGERSLGQNLAMIGVLGWLIVTPALIGIVLGRWLDRHHGHGIFWTSTCLCLGLALGGWMAWRRMQEA